MSAVEIRDGGRDLRAPAAVVDWVLSGADGDAVPQALRDAGGVAGAGELTDGLRAIRNAVRSSRVDLQIERGDRRGRGWIGPEGAVLAHSLSDGRGRVVTVGIALMVDALVRLNDVGPRPAPRSSRIRCSPGPLAQALAARDPARAQIADGGQRDEFAQLVGALREHWRVAVHWDPAEGALSGRDIEVLDTDRGYWLVVPDGAGVELWPSTATDVLRGLCELFPLPTEVNAWTTT